MRLLVLAFLLASSVALSLPTNPPTIPTIATGALRDSFEQVQGERWEYGGIITRYMGHLYASAPVTDKQCCEVIIHVNSLLQNGHVLIGTYHTHPCYPVSHFTNRISPNDKAFALYYMVPIYVLNGCNGDVMTFDPMNKLAYGKDPVVGNIGEFSPSQDR